MDTVICPESGKVMKRGVRPMTLAYKDLKLTFDMPGWYPDGAGDGLHSGRDLKISDRKLNLLKARAGNLLEPDEIKRIRRKLGLTQKEAGRIIGGGVNAFQKYESGDILVSRAISSALRLLDHDPSGLDILRCQPQSAA